MQAGRPSLLLGVGGLRSRGDCALGKPSLEVDPPKPHGARSETNEWDLPGVDPGAQVAAQAAVDVASAAQFRAGVWHLDALAVLYGLTRDRLARCVVFLVDRQEVAVERHLLTRFGRVARRLPQLVCFVGDGTLCFRWREGARGGLTLRCDPPGLEHAVRVVLMKPRPKQAPVFFPELLL